MQQPQFSENTNPLISKPIPCKIEAGKLSALRHHFRKPLCPLGSEPLIGIWKLDGEI